MHPWLLFIDLLIFAWPIASHTKCEKLNMCSAHSKRSMWYTCDVYIVHVGYTQVHSRSIESIFNTKSNECLKGQTHTHTTGTSTNKFVFYLSFMWKCVQNISLFFPTSLTLWILSFRPKSNKIELSVWFIHMYSKLASIIEFLFHLKCFTPWVSVLANTSTKCLLFVFDLLPPTKTIFWLVHISERYTTVRTINIHIACSYITQFGAVKMQNTQSKEPNRV